MTTLDPIAHYHHESRELAQADVDALLARYGSINIIVGVTHVYRRTGRGNIVQGIAPAYSARRQATRQ